MADSIDDVLLQIEQHQIHVPAGLKLEADGKKKTWAGVAGKSKKNAWAVLHEWRSPRTDKLYIVGRFGIRDDHWAVEPSQSEWTPQEKAAWIEKRKALEREADEDRRTVAEAAREKAAKLWARARDNGVSKYLQRKRVGAYGIRFAFGNSIVVPLFDVEGTLHGLQWIGDDGSKRFGTGTVKEAHFHLLGDIADGVPIGFAEGYATAASGHVATRWPVVTCFDAGNLQPVMAAWRKLYPEHQFVVLGDDDRHLLPRLVERLRDFGVQTSVGDFKPLNDATWDVPDRGKVVLRAAWKRDPNDVWRIEGSIEADGQTHLLKLENAGRAKAMAAAKKVKALAVFPRFGEGAGDATDWNDLHVLEDIEAVRQQILDGVDPDKIAEREAARKAEKKAVGKGGAAPPSPDGESPFNRFLARFTLIYGTTTVWDAHERKVIKLESLKAAFGGMVDWWLTHPDRRMIPEQNVVFDPTCTVDEETHINLFGGLAMVPDTEASCELLIEHLRNLCRHDDALFHWVASWLAYPLQNVGAKMRTAIVMHGRTEGTGKSFLADVMRDIYGTYARSISQLQLQSEYTGWMSSMLFCVAEEVVSAQERKHLKGLIQNMITNPTIQINEKHLPVRQENNYANFMFFSNEQVPMLLNKSDRRNTVIKVETVYPPAYFEALSAEREAGGARAFLHWLLQYDVKGFNPFTRPFKNRERMQLITLGMTVDQRFFEFWSKGLADLPFCHCAAPDLYNAFKAWARINGERYIPNNTQFGSTVGGELELMGARRKQKARYKAFSEKAVADQDFTSADAVIPRQGIVYYVPASLPDDEDAQAPPSDAPVGAPGPAEGGDAPADVSTSVQAFQKALGALLAIARRAL